MSMIAIEWPNWSHRHHPQFLPQRFAVSSTGAISIPSSESTDSKTKRWALKPEGHQLRPLPTTTTPADGCCRGGGDGDGGDEAESIRTKLARTGQSWCGRSTLGDLPEGSRESNRAACCYFPRCESLVEITVACRARKSRRWRKGVIPGPDRAPRQSPLRIESPYPECPANCPAGIAQRTTDQLDPRYCHHFHLLHPGPFRCSYFPSDSSYFSNFTISILIHENKRKKVTIN